MMATRASATMPADEADDDIVRVDPIGTLAMAAGYPDGELWWEHQIEQRHDAAGLFDGHARGDDARCATRSPTPRTPRGRAARGLHAPDDPRARMKEGFERIAVVCGAWHAPVLRRAGARPSPTPTLLKGLPKAKVVATWIPWTTSRLSYRSGYGAGIDVARLVRAPLDARPSSRPLRWTVARGATAARGGSRRSAGQRDRERCAWPRPWPRCAACRMPGLARAGRGMQAVLCGGETGAAGAHPRSAGARRARWARCPTGDARRAAAARPRAPQERRLRLKRDRRDQDARPRPAQRRPTARAAASAPAAPARASPWGKPEHRARQERHLPRALAAALAARARGRA